jgi:hypothetical protein
VTIVTASGAPMPPLASSLLKKPVDLDVLLRIVGQSCDVPAKDPGNGR